MEIPVGLLLASGKEEKNTMTSRKRGGAAERKDWKKEVRARLLPTASPESRLGARKKQKTEKQSLCAARVAIVKVVFSKSAPP